MKNWEHTAREHLKASEMPPSIRDEVVAELAAHLEEAYDAASSRGLNHAEALAVTLQEIGDWRVLAEEIACAKSTEDSMNQRTKSFWMPAFASLTAVSLFTLALTEIGMQPRFIERLNSTFAPFLYLAWLLSNLFFGALGAFLSRRAGGSRLARVLAGTFPAIVMFGLCAVAIPVSAVFEPNPFVLHHPFVVVEGILVWAGAPGVALLAGASPFLRETPLQVT